MIKARTTYAQAITVALVAASLMVGFAARAQDVKLGDLRPAVQKLRDDERRLSQERITRFRAEQQKVERQAQEAVAASQRGRGTQQRARQDVEREREAHRRDSTTC